MGEKFGSPLTAAGAPAKVTALFTFQGLAREEVAEASAGDIVAVAGVGVYVQLDEKLETFTHARICLCAVAPVPLRATGAEAALVGKPATAETIAAAAKAAAADARPISDQRGTADFRRLLVEALTVKTLTPAVEAIRGAR